MACTSKMQRFLVVVPSTQFWDSWRFWAYFSPSTRFHWFCLPWKVRIDRRLRPPCWHVLTLKLCFGVMSRPAWASFLPERRLVISSLLLLSQVFLPWHLAHVDWLAISWLELSITLVAWSPSFGPFADANIYIYIIWLIHNFPSMPSYKSTFLQWKQAELIFTKSNHLNLQMWSSCIRLVPAQVAPNIKSTWAGAMRSFLPAVSHVILCLIIYTWSVHVYVLHYPVRPLNTIV